MMKVCKTARAPRTVRARGHDGSLTGGWLVVSTFLPSGGPPAKVGAGADAGTPQAYLSARPLRPTESVSAGISRNLALELVRVTEAGALASARWMGRGDKNSADGAAVEAMRLSLGKIEMDGVVVIGEGEKDEAPMLYIGERIGSGVPPQVDIAVDPVEGTTLLSKGLPNAISVIAMAGGRGSLYDAKHVAYMHKLATGADAAGSFNIEDPIGVNLQRIARAKRMRVSALSVVILDRPRHECL